MLRALIGAALVCGLLAIAPAAHATLTLSQSPDAIVVTGDGGPNLIQVQDGSTSGGDDYAFAFYSENDEPVDLGNSGCGSDDGTPVETVYCGTGAFNKAVFNLGGGNDTLGSYNDPQFQVLGALRVDLGPGGDQNEGGAFYRIPTTFLGGEGDDDLAGQEGPSSIVEGGPGNDRISGGGAVGGETLRGGPGDDQINGLGGDDAVFGDEGADALVGGAGGDTITGGAGRDNVQGDATANAFSGNDTLQLTDGEQDVASCGFGADRVFADAIDLTPAQDCESITVFGAAPSGPPPGLGTIPVGGSAKLALAKPGKLSARKRTLSLRVSCPASASGSCSGRVTFSLRFTQRRKRRKAGAGSASFILAPGGRRTISRKLSKQLVRRLRRARKRTLTVKATSRDGAGRTFTSRRTAALKLKR